MATQVQPTNRHINGVKVDNDVSNLYVCTQRDHALAHASFGALLTELVTDGIVAFDRETGRYFRA